MIFETGIHELPTRSTKERTAILVDDFRRIARIVSYSTPREAAQAFDDLWRHYDGTADRIEGWAQYERWKKRAVNWEDNALMHAQIERKKQAKLRRQAAAEKRARKVA